MKPSVQLGANGVLDLTSTTHNPFDAGVRRPLEVYVKAISSVLDKSLLAYFRDIAARRGVHLTADWEFVISTPNPLFVRHVARASFARPIIANFKHFICVAASNLIELVRLMGMYLKAIHYRVRNSSSIRADASIKRARYHLIGTALFTTNVYVISGTAARS